MLVLCQYLLFYFWEKLEHLFITNLNTEVYTLIKLLKMMTFDAIPIYILL